MTTNASPIPFRPRLGAALAAVLLAGCAAVGPDRPTPAAGAPATWSAWHGGDPSLMPASSTATQPTAERWAALGDATLRRLLALAEQDNPDLATASLRVLQARALEATASAQRGPQLGARTAASRQRLSESGTATRLVEAIAPGGTAQREQLIGFLASPYTVYQAGFDASWELDLWGRVRRSVEQAAAQRDEADAAARQVQLTLAADVVRAYHQWRGLQAQQALLAGERDAAQEAEALLAAQVRGGLVDEQPLLARRQRLREVETRAQALTLESAAATNRLTLLCGQAPGALNEVLEAARASTAPAPLPALALGLPSDLVRQRPDVSLAEARLASATAAIGVAIADLYPRVTIGASFGVETLHESRLGDWGARQWSVGPSLSVPLFDQGRRRATVTLRELQQQEAAVAFQQTVLRAWHEVDDALSAYAGELQQRATLDARVALADETLALARARHDRGLTDYLPVLDGLQASLQTHQAQADSDARLRVRLVALYKALGNDGSLRLAA